MQIRALFFLLLMSAMDVHAAPIALTWDCPAGGCATYSLARDIGCTGQWTYLRSVSTPSAIVTTTPGMPTCWRVSALDAQGREGPAVTTIRVMEHFLTDAAGTHAGYCIETQRP